MSFYRNDFQNDLVKKHESGPRKNADFYHHGGLAAIKA